MNPTKTRLSRRDFLKTMGVGSAAALLAGCGGGATQAPAPAVTQAATQPATPAAAGGLSFKGTLDVWDWEFPGRQAVFQKFIDGEWAAKYPDIKINLRALPWGDMETKILAVSTAKNGPPMSNVFFFWRYELERAGVLNPFPDDFTNWDDRISTPFMTDDGKIRALPSGWYMDMIYYNKQMLDKAGIKPEAIPTQWDEFIKMAQQFVQKDSNGKLTQLGCIMNDYWQHEYLWCDLIYQQGGWMYNEDGTKSLWDAPEAVNALQFIQDWYHTNQIDSLEFPVGYTSFGNQSAPFFLGSGWNTVWLLNDFPDFADQWDTVPMPTLSGKPGPSWGLACPEEGMQVFNYFPDDQQEACTMFIKDLYTGDQSEVGLILGQWCAPDSRHLMTDPRIEATKSLKAMITTMPWRVCPGERPIEAEKLWRTMFDKVTLEKGDAKAAAQEAAAAINAELPKKKRYFTERNYVAPGA